MKYIFPLLLIFTTVGIANAQTAETLKKQMWEPAAKCFEAFEDENGDGKPDGYELIDDRKNGYLKLSGAWPTCGCGCEVTVGAYKHSDGKYTVLNMEDWNCSWLKKMDCSRPIGQVLPEGFGLATFIPGWQSKAVDSVNAVFYLEVEIPQTGTDTKVTLALIPFGIKERSLTPLAFAYQEAEGFRNCKMLTELSAIAENIALDATLDALLNNQYDQIAPADRKILDASIGGEYNQFASIVELAAYLRILNSTHQLYEQVEFQSVILGWDKLKGRFFVKERAGKPEPVSFRAFLQSGKYWSPSC